MDDWLEMCVNAVPPAVMKYLCICLVLIITNHALGAPVGNTVEGTVTNTICGTDGNGQVLSYINACRFQATSGGVVGKMVAKVGAISGQYRCAVYADASGTPGALLGGTTALANVATGWHDFPMTAPVTITNGSFYWLAIWSNDAEATVYETPGGTLRWGLLAYAPAWPSAVTLPNGPASASYSLYADAASAGAAVAVTGNNVSIADGDTTSDEADGTWAGGVLLDGATSTSTFTILNSGLAALGLTGSPNKVVISGPHAADFTVTAVPATTVVAGGSTTFTIQFDPSGIGARTATVTIAHSAEPGNAFDFVISGNGVVPNGAPQSLFASTRTGNDSGAENTHYELGTIFRSDVAGSITQLRVYALASESGNHTARVWRNSDSSILGGPYTWSYGGTAGWITLDIPDLPVAANTDYTVVVSTGAGGKNYPFLPGDLALAGGNGVNLSHPVKAGVFTNTVGARPTQAFGNNNYFRDVVFSSVPTEPPTNGPVRISEFVTDNESGLTDEDGELGDWIELYNPTGAPINLGGYQLQDSSATWTFPSVTLNAQSYLVVFATSKNRTAQPGNLHTNFKLSKEGEYLVLKDETGSVIGDFGTAFPAQATDYSYGRRTDGQAVYFRTPTPGSANGFSFLGFVADTQFSVKRGFYTTPQTVAITTATAGATIRYTVDGSTPTETHGTVYTAPLTVSATTTLRARAFLSDFLPTGVDTQTYIFLSDVLQQTATTAQAYGWPAGPVNGQEFRHGMKPVLTAQYTSAQMLAALQQVPTMSIVTDQANLTDPSTGIYVNPGGDGSAWERPISLEMINPDGTPGFQENCGLRIRGGQSRSPNFPKHSFHVNFRSEYGAGKLDFPLFGEDGADEFDTFDLRCEHGYAYADPQGATLGTEYTAIRDVFCRDLSALSGYAATRSKPYHLFINGQYWGLYQTQERPQEDYGESYFGGDKEEYDVIKATGLPQLTIECSEGNYDAWTALWNGCRTVSSTPTNANYFSLLGRNADGTKNVTLPVLLDPAELAGYMLLHYYCGHSDEPLSVSFNFEKPNNFRAMRRRGMTDPFHFFVHDAESSMYAPEWVNNRANAVNLTSGNRALFGFSNPEWMHEDLLANAEYRIAFADEAQRLLYNGGAFTEGTSKPYWDARAAEITEAVIGESIRWGNAAAHNQTNWAAKVAQVRSSFFGTRTATVITQLRQRNLFPSVNAPVFSLRGGQVPVNYALSLSAAGQIGEVYYTTDGSDPRLIGGDPRPAAGHTTQPAQVVITGPMTVKTRFRSSAGEWSAMDSAVFTNYPAAVAADIVVSELHYHAPDPSSAELTAYPGITDAAFDFIELMNISSETKDLSGVKITVGVTFDFAGAPAAARFLAPGARVVVVSNPGPFAMRLASGNTPVVAGTYSGAFSNGSETVTIVDKNGATIKSFAYSDSAPWPKDADGSGRSLVLNRPLTNPDHNLPTSWRPSATLHGAPGLAKSTPPPAAPYADDDSNGIANVIEYATGPAPKLAITGESYTPPAGIAATYSYFRFPRSLSADGPVYVAQSSTDLVTWTTTQLTYLSTNVTSGGMATVTYRSTVPTSALGPHFFVRLQIQP